jgi:hypothetical protein
MPGGGQLQILEEYAGHVRVIMLAGMDKDFFKSVAQCAGHHGSLYKLRPCADNRDYFHNLQSFPAAERFFELCPNRFVAFKPSRPV